MSAFDEFPDRDPSLPLVSVVVNNYNNERYLPACLGALLIQTYRNIEIVVVDAFSTDNSRVVIDAFAERDGRIKKVYCEAYVKYPAITYNLGFLNCNGNYVAINDPDDISMPERIEAQLRFLLDNREVDVVGCNCYEFNEDFEKLVVTTVERNLLRAAVPVRNPCLLFRKALLAEHGMWRWQCEYAADFEWLYRWYIGGVRFHIIEPPYVRFRKQHGTNISFTKQLNQESKVAIFRTLYGIRLFRTVGLRWWLATAKSYAYICARLLLPDWLISKYMNRKR